MAELDEPSPAEWRCGAPAILLHRSLALPIAFMAGLGWVMMTIEHEPGGLPAIALHRSIGAQDRVARDAPAGAAAAGRSALAGPTLALRRGRALRHTT